MYGLQVVEDPTEAELDIVFVHGLHGNRRDTWTSGSVFWPKDLLPQSVPKARILSYGYDAHIVHFWSRPADNRIDTFSNDLFSQLTNKRVESNSFKRPLIFVAHSLGGIVVANGIVDAATNSYAELSQYIFGIVFLGTPHKGSDKASWADQALKFISLFKVTNAELGKDLQEKSEKLSKIGDSFPNLLTTRNKKGKTLIEIICFFEGQPMNLAGIIVPEVSATLDGYPKILLNADHSAMCKFTSKEDNKYQQVVGFIVNWAKNIAEGGRTKDTKKWSSHDQHIHGVNYGNIQHTNTGHQNFNFGGAK